MEGKEERKGGEMEWMERVEKGEGRIERRKEMRKWMGWGGRRG